MTRYLIERTLPGAGALTADEHRASSVMGVARWWMRAVGAFYVLLCVMATLVRLPIKVEGPPGVLDRAAAGDPTARFVVDTWVAFGLELGAVGVALLIASRVARQVGPLIGTVLGMEVAGIAIDVYKIARGKPPGESVAWIVIHLVIIATGLIALRGVALAKTSGRSAFAP